MATDLLPASCVRFLLVAAIPAVLCGCGFLGGSERQEFKGNYYPARLSVRDGSQLGFVINVERAGQGLEGAREAGEYAATIHCLRTFGRSDVVWLVGPDNAAPGDGPLRRDMLTLEGYCDE